MGCQGILFLKIEKDDTLNEGVTATYVYLTLKRKGVGIFGIPDTISLNWSVQRRARSCGNSPSSSLVLLPSSISTIVFTKALLWKVMNPNLANQLSSRVGSGLSRLSKQMEFSKSRLHIQEESSW
ncbi:hypothetical protein LR48_Vigan11g107400 [Vigna angularis]|uniref:Uncharacterized protein n=1 Tax=Phaseolus angularis TaxID=3914 RepID=A0A0L9VSJ5_PHAAN|nr:hypothetical protein LR48_Vigan11g107400 [Vigna angularis]